MFFTRLENLVHGRIKSKTSNLSYPALIKEVRNLDRSTPISWKYECLDDNIVLDEDIITKNGLIRALEKNFHEVPDSYIDIVHATFYNKNEEAHYIEIRRGDTYTKKGKIVKRPPYKRAEARFNIKKHLNNSLLEKIYES